MSSADGAYAHFCRPDIFGGSGGSSARGGAVGADGVEQGDLSEAHTEANIEEKLRADLMRLFGMLQGRNVLYVLVGGVAMLTYVDGRNTKYVDLVLSVSSLERLPEITIVDRKDDFARGVFGNLRVDVLFTTNPLFKLVQESYVSVHRFLETDVRTASVEGLILLKLYALPALYRQGDGQRIGLYENDVFMLCEQHRPDMNQLFEVLQAHVDEDAMRELRGIAAEIQQRVERVDRARRKARP